MKKFRGVFPAIVAPQDDKNEILFDVMGDLAKRQVADGAGGHRFQVLAHRIDVPAGDERLRLDLRPREAHELAEAARGDVRAVEGDEMVGE